MTVAQMRCAIYDIYPGDSWHEKVNNMPDNQVVAVYYSLLARGVFTKRPTGLDIPIHITVEAKGEDEPHFKPLVGEQLKLF